MMYVMKGDIVGLDFDLIVNPANSNLLPTEGVNRRIYEAAGRRMLNELIEYAPLEEGKAVMTNSYDLPCKKIIHTACPNYCFHEEEEEEILAACYWNSIALAYEYLRGQSKPRISIAFPEISIGAHGFPKDEACHIAVSTIERLFNRYPEAQMIDVWFVLRDEESYTLYKKELKTGSPRLKAIPGIRSRKKKDEADKEQVQTEERITDLSALQSPFINPEMTFKQDLSEVFSVNSGKIESDQSGSASRTEEQPDGKTDTGREAEQ